MQAAGHFVAAAAELASRMEHRQHHLQGGLLQLGLLIHRDAAAIVDDGDAAIGVNGDVDGVTVAGHGLVDAVVDDLANEVVQAANVGAADVHARPAADRLQALEHLDVLGAVGPWLA